MFSKKFSTPIALVSLLMISVWLSGGRAAAAPSPVVLTALPPAEQEAGKPLALAARLTDGSTNRPLGSMTVEFFILTEVFGPRLMSVGQATTDTTGRAAVAYKPSWEGETKTVVRFRGNAEYAAAEIGFQFNAVGPIALHENAEFGLKPIRAVAPYVVFAIVAGVWATLIFVLGSTVRGIALEEVGVRGRVSAVPARAAGQAVEP